MTTFRQDFKVLAKAVIYLGYSLCAVENCTIRHQTAPRCTVPYCIGLHQNSKWKTRNTSKKGPAPLRLFDWSIKNQESVKTLKVCVSTIHGCAKIIFTVRDRRLPVLPTMCRAYSHCFALILHRCLHYKRPISSSRCNDGLFNTFDVVYADWWSECLRYNVRPRHTTNIYSIIALSAFWMLSNELTFCKMNV